MDSPVTNRANDTLKQVMAHMTQTNSSLSFLINDNEQVTGVITVRDVFLQFAPPCVNSSIGGGGFFEMALEQSGCRVNNGTIIRNRWTRYAPMHLLRENVCIRQWNVAHDKHEDIFEEFGFRTVKNDSRDDLSCWYKLDGWNWFIKLPM